MVFTVTRSSGIAVRPSESTPTGTLELSMIDKWPLLRGYVSVLLVFRHGNAAAKVISEAMSKALVPYYPLAGRLTESSDGELQIACTGDGVWFVEASANCSLASVNYFDNILLVPADELLATLPPDSYCIQPLARMQVTQFGCGGFVVGWTICHTIADGYGGAQFLNAVGDFARGFQHPKIRPVWQREAIPISTKLAREFRQKTLPLAPPPTETTQEHATIDVPLNEINKLKSEFFESTGYYCSSFDVVIASLWRHRTKSIKLEKDTEVNLIFQVNGRHLLDPPLPEGYYGNCFYAVTVTSTSGWIVEASNAQVVKCIKDAKARAPAEFRKWVKSDELGYNATQFAYTTLVVTEWSSLGFNKVDFGWDQPVHFLPMQGVSNMSIVVAGLPPKPKNGIRLMTWCTNSIHLSSLLHFYRTDLSLSRL